MHTSEVRGDPSDADGITADVFNAKESASSIRCALKDIVPPLTAIRDDSSSVLVKASLVHRPPVLIDIAFCGFEKLSTRDAVREMTPSGAVMSSVTVKLPEPWVIRASEAERVSELLGNNDSAELTSILPGTLALKL